MLSISRKVAGIAAVRSLLGELEDTVKDLKQAVKALESDADGDSFEVLDSGNVVDLLVDVDEEDKAKREELRKSLEDEAHQLLRRADDAQADAARILNSVASGHIPVAFGASPEAAAEQGAAWADKMFTAPRPPEDVYEQQAYFDRLSVRDQEELLNDYPEWLTTSYGLHPEVRDKAARNYIPQLKSKLRGNLSDAEADYGEDSDLARRIHNKIDDLDAIEAQVLNADGDENLSILGLRETKEGVGVVIARGDITSARHQVTQVPGMTTNVRDRLGDELGKSRDMRDEMSFIAERNGGDEGDIAVVSYLGADFPANLYEASSSEYADSAAGDLSDVLDGVDAVSSANSEHSVQGHSYGSLMASEALQEGGHADSVVFYGSPGIESDLFGTGFSEENLGAPEGRVYSMQSWDDPIEIAANSQKFGGAPHSHEGIGRLETNPEYLEGKQEYRGLTMPSGHSEYNTPGTTSLRNLSLVAMGQYEALPEYDQEARYEKGRIERERQHSQGIINPDVDSFVR